jgi:oligopeptide transport system substrate-binding protein
LRLATPTRRLVAPLIANSAPPALPDEPEDIGDRIAEANALLEEAGYGPDNPLPLRLRSLNNDNATRTSFSRSELIETLWRQRRSFIEIETLTASSDEHYAALSEGDYDVALAGWAPDFNDPLAYLYRYRFRNNGSNFINFEDDEYQDLLRQAEQETDPAARAELLADAESLLLESYALVPIARRNVFSLVSPRLRGWEPNPIGFHPSRWMSLEAKMQ